TISGYPVKNFDRISISDCESSSIAENNGKSNNFGKESLKSTVPPKAFTEKGLYMLATILKSPQATETTIAIVEAFAKLKQLSTNLAALHSMEPEVVEPEVLESTGGLLEDLLFSGIPTAAETSVELNLGVVKLKRSVKSEHAGMVRSEPTIDDKLDGLEQRLDRLDELLKTLGNG
ncbi:MAG: ORF6N domain-containing protein, partial [Bacteroidales bacterium]|nr:ORF6N domain-containing protein [Bacteroidales bacterium]